MIAVISEVWPHEARRQEYFDLSERLRPLLQAIDGFISVERFASTVDAGKYVSLSFWRDEAALARWRDLEEHRLVMAQGRDGILRDYRIKVTRLAYEYGMQERENAPLAD
jgi:heme-degrading monooxygenase HmoA